MTVFPVTNSTLSPDHLAEFIQKEYQFNNGVSCKLLKTGISHTYLITTVKENIFSAFIRWTGAQEMKFWKNSVLLIC